MKRLIFFSVMVLLIWSTKIFSQDAVTSIIKERLQHKLDSLQRVNKFPGVTFAAVLPNGEKISIAAGMADSVQQTPMLPKSRMFSGSNGKTLFAAAVLMQMEKGLFKLDDKIEQYIGNENWFKRIPNANTITFRMLMNHTSGIEEYYELGDFMQKLKAAPAHIWTPVEILTYVFDRKPLFAAGEGWGYADTNYILLCYIIEKISGKKMYVLIKQEVIKAYALGSTEPSVKQKFDHMATGYSRAGGPFPFSGAVAMNGNMAFNPQFEWAGGGFISNSTDLAIWAKGFYNFKGLSVATLKDMQQGVPAKTGRGHLYGLGLQIRPDNSGGMSYGHSGWFPGYLTDAAYFPSTGLSMAIQFNTDNTRLLKKSTYGYLLDLEKVILGK